MDRKEAGSKGKDHGKEKGSLERKREAWKGKGKLGKKKGEVWNANGKVG